MNQVLDELTRRMAQLGGTRPAEPPEVPGDGLQGALACLRVLAGVKECVRDLEDEAAHAAAAHGAGYPEIGRAVDMSRQGARRRWPGLITNDPHRPVLPPHPRSS
ncbi:hypothetical protein SZN_19265 [Streptomyces zinciresistens K42]|uniref:Uncharacterized protein n=1 Tax=Streptomyces zinciresistens K42 TaxID=700597 RepID=G2GEC0_9ACTN|nr:hypothetical protein SZN_19265 [Streptomyces zinciresistens K42]